MALYIGYIDFRQSYYNYKPMARIESDNSITILSYEDRECLLEGSRNQNINLFYDYKDSSEVLFMRETFIPGDLVVFDFEVSELEENWSYDGSRNQTGFKVAAVEAWDNKIYPISKFGLYYLVAAENSSKENDLFRDKVFFVSDVPKGSQALISLDNHDHVYGPYRVEERERDHALYVMPRIKDNLSLASSFHTDLCTQVTIRETWPSETQWNLVMVKKNTAPEFVDVATDQDLIENFQDALQKGYHTSESINVSELLNYVNNSKASLIASPRIPKNIQNQRLDRLNKLLSSILDFNGSFNDVSSLLTSSIVRFIKTNPNSEESDMFVGSILKKDPDLIEKIKDQRIISNKLKKRRQEIDDLERQKDAITHEIEELTEQKNSIKKTFEDSSYIEVLKQSKNKEIQHLDKQIKEAKRELDEYTASVETIKSLEELRKQKSNLESRINALHEHETYAKECFQEVFSKNQKKMQEIVFDGFVSNKLIQSAAQWEISTSNNIYDKVVLKEKCIASTTKKPKELVDYLYSVINQARPDYSKNQITNMAICIFQGFLTVFSGPPGCGKTSICNILANALGLNKISDDLVLDGVQYDRYIQISVERGWTSKKDLIGYYNPLSKSFDKSDRRLFDGLNLLDIENKRAVSKFPYLVLLDEANLSPMEYYWADFMNVCDDLKKNNKINFGEDYIFSIPKTLHFVATINNDHTTETLSPRLIDRAWIITLPQFSFAKYGKEISKEQIEAISWSSIEEAFIPAIEPDYKLPDDIYNLYEGKIKQYLQKMRISISSRADLSIKRYFMVASNLFEKEVNNEDVNYIALDYAILQKVLPKISGSGPIFKGLLEGLRDLFRDNSLTECQERVHEMIINGDSQMGYYSFFN